MRSTLATLSIVLTSASWAGAEPASPKDARPNLTITVTNPTDDRWSEAPVTVRVDPAWNLPPGVHNRQVVANGVASPLQSDDLNGDGREDQWAFLVSLAPHESKTFLVSDLSTPQNPAPPKRTHARMSLKGYDGVGWESDVVAYRIYWNLDNATDIFCKNRPILSLDYWATPGIAHNTESKYGIDVLKVGRAIGLGAFGLWRDGTIHKVTNVMKDYHIRADGPICSVVDLEYVHWIVGHRDPDAKFVPGTKLDTYDMNVRMSIFAGQKWAQADITIAPARNSAPPELVTAIPIHEDTDLIQDRDAGIVGRWGRQALGDREVPKAAHLGMGLIVAPTQTIDYGSDGINQYVRLKPREGKISYRYHGSWSKEPDGAHSTKEYESMLRRVAGMKPQVKIEVVKN